MTRVTLFFRVSRFFEGCHAFMFLLVILYAVHSRVSRFSKGCHGLDRDMCHAFCWVSRFFEGVSHFCVFRVLNTCQKISVYCQISFIGDLAGGWKRFWMTPTAAQLFPFKDGKNWQIELIPPLILLLSPVENLGKKSLSMLLRGISRECNYP